MYRINPDAHKSMKVMCDMTTAGGGWTVFQRRVDGSVKFYRGWKEYKFGFGNLSGEFWLGNDNLHHIAAADNMTLRVDLEDFDGNVTFAEYSIFKVANATDKYRISDWRIQGHSRRFTSGAQVRKQILIYNHPFSLTIGESLFTLFGSLTYANHYLMTLIK